jgi:hypothetical protein
MSESAKKKSGRNLPEPPEFFFFEKWRRTRFIEHAVSQLSFFPVFLMTEGVDELPSIARLGADPRWSFHVSNSKQTNIVSHVATIRTHVGV